ncbi:MAG TPA: cobaltochelatase subunit CobN, partial [Guyparkeria sp.]|nr:cobaltochelatase subunit CobN [Guyparkeria sp.]
MRKPNLSNIVSWSVMAKALLMLALLAAFIACANPSKASADPASDAATALDHHVAILATEFVLEHKFRLLEQAAKEQGIELRWTQVDRDDESGIAAVLADADLIIIDAPRSDDQSVVTRIASEQLTGQDAPVVHLNHFTRERPLWAERLEMTTAQRIAEYYLAGTTTNRQRLFAYLHALLSGSNPEAVPPVQPLPDGGIYHSGYPDQVFAELQAYLHWWETHHDSEWRGRPVIAVETTSSYLSDGQTRWMDDVIAQIEASDALPLVYYRTSDSIRRAVDSNSPPSDTRNQIPTAADLFPNPKSSAGPSTWPSTWPSAWQAGDDPMITLDGHLLPDVVLVNN